MFGLPIAGPPGAIVLLPHSVFCSPCISHLDLSPPSGFDPRIIREAMATNFKLVVCSALGLRQSVAAITRLTEEAPFPPPLVCCQSMDDPSPVVEVETLTA